MVIPFCLRFMAQCGSPSIGKGDDGDCLYTTVTERMKEKVRFFEEKCAVFNTAEVSSRQEAVERLNRFGVFCWELAKGAHPEQSWRSVRVSDSLPLTEWVSARQQRMKEHYLYPMRGR
jgi:hypothetical protein